LLYEMASGRRPFDPSTGSGSPRAGSGGGGASFAELASAILRDAPRPLSEIRADLPADLTRVIHRCLEKDPALRIQTARDVFNEIEALRSGSSSLAPQDSRRVTGSTPPASRQSSSAIETGREGVPWIAVLPLKTQGSDPELAAFADGLCEDITAGLSRFSHLSVISRHSAVQHSETSLDVRAIGRELGPAPGYPPGHGSGIVGGSWRKEGPRSSNA
jgi:serine/threonine-protein kinase